MTLILISLQTFSSPCWLRTIHIRFSLLRYAHKSKISSCFTQVFGFDSSSSTKLLSSKVEKISWLLRQPCPIAKEIASTFRSAVTNRVPEGTMSPVKAIWGARQPVLKYSQNFCESRWWLQKKKGSLGLQDIGHRSSGNRYVMTPSANTK